MGLTTVTRSVQWSQTGTSGWNDITDDALKIEVVLESLDQGIPHFTLEIDNTGGKHNTDWPPFTPNEKGLYYFVIIRFAGQRILVGRFEGIDPILASGHNISLDGLIVGGVDLSKSYGSFVWNDEKWDDAVEEVLKYLDKDGLLFEYSSASSGTTITKQPVDEWCHDLIRKICESEGLAGCLRPASSDTKVIVDLFVKNSESKRHTTILKSIIPDQSTLIKTGEVPRDLNETFNMIDLTGGKSERAPVDGDAWTESLVGWHTVSNNFTLGLTTEYVCNLFNVDNPPEGEVVSTQSIKFQPFASFSGAAEAKLVFPEVLSGELFDCEARKASLIVFRWMCGDVQFPSLTGMTIRLKDANGTMIEAQVSEAWFAVLPKGQWGLMQQRIGSDLLIHDVSPRHMRNGEWFYSMDPGNNAFDWTRIQEMHFAFESTGFYNLPVYIDRLYIVQDFIPKVRVQDPVKIEKYGRRMQPFSVPEMYEPGVMKAYGLKILKATATPTFVIDATFLHDPATEVILPGYGIRFNIPAWGISETLYWRSIRVHYVWSRQEGLVLRVIAVPATSGSEDYSYLLASKTWTILGREGLDKNIGDAIRRLGTSANKHSDFQIDRTVQTPLLVVPQNKTERKSH
jgi:hypothetical protein